MCRYEELFGHRFSPSDAGTENRGAASCIPDSDLQTLFGRDQCLNVKFEITTRGSRDMQDIAILDTFQAVRERSHVVQ